MNLLTLHLLQQHHRQFLCRGVTPIHALHTFAPRRRMRCTRRAAPWSPARPFLPAVPFTLSHPAAVLPLRRCCPRWLDFPALVIGSMTPDFAYYLPGCEPPLPTHSFPGSIVLCLPAGLLLLAALHWLKRPLCFVLPQPHRGALAPLAAAKRSWNVRTFSAAGLSVLLGAWTHIAWDCFTHIHGWGVEHLALLRLPLWSSGARPFAVFDGLQWLSGAGGGLLLLWLYRRWLRRQPPVEDAGNDRWRLWLLITIAASSAALAAPPALHLMAPYRGGLAARVFLFQLWVHAALFGALSLSAASLLIQAGRGAA